MNDRIIADDGTPDAVWLPWLARQRVASVSVAALCSSASRLVVIAPHPDDEILACGGLMAMCALQRMTCVVVAVTDGEASHGRTDAPALAALALVRAQESNAGLQALGVSPACVVRLKLADGDVASCVEKLAVQISPLLRPSDVVVTTWHLDGHPDHEAVSTAARRACAAVPCRLLQAPVWMWHWAKPDDARVPWSSLLALDLSAQAITAKRQALMCHASQLEPRSADVDPVLMPSIIERSWRQQEYFFQ